MESTNKRILVFTDWFLPGYKAGGPITSCANLVRHLSSRFDFYLVCRDRDYLESEPYANIDTDEWVEAFGIKVMYLSPRGWNRRRINELIQGIQPHTIYINGIFSKVFSVMPVMAAKKYSARSNTRIILAPRGMLAPSALGLKPIKKKAFLYTSKLLGLFRNLRFHATNAREREDINRWFPKSRISVVENIPGIPVPFEKKVMAKEENTLRLYSLARIAPEKNIDFALNCLQQIPKKLEISFDLIGSVYDEAYARKCREIAKSLPKNVTVRFHKPISPILIPSFVKNYDAFFLPTRGENYGHAIIEALLMGFPVIISDKTPWKDLSKRGLGFDLPLQREKFTEALISLAEMNRELFLSTYKEVNIRAEQLIDVDKIRSGYEDLFDG